MAVNRPGGRGDQRFSDARRDHAQAGRSRRAQPGECVHHAPHGPEQSDEGSHRSRGRQPGHVPLELANFVRGRYLHVRRYGVAGSSLADAGCWPPVGWSVPDIPRHTPLPAESRWNPRPWAPAIRASRERRAESWPSADSAEKTNSVFERSRPRKTGKRQNRINSTARATQPVCSIRLLSSPAYKQTASSGIVAFSPTITRQLAENYRSTRAIARSNAPII